MREFDGLLGRGSRQGSCIGSQMAGALLMLVVALVLVMIPASPVLASGATTAVRIVKYADDGVTIIADRTVSYRWMQENLPVLGDGQTHYYHQGPIFEGDLWDPEEVNNLKDKGAVKGTDVKDLCDLVGGMKAGEELMFRAVDGWVIKFKFGNVYEPSDRQGPVTLCWYNGEDSLVGERYGVGYPGQEAYRTALQIVIMARTTNSEGKYVFGNSDMKEVLPPEEGYSHFYQGAYPSTNGLSGKWISELFIYSHDAPPDLPEPDEADTDTGKGVPWLPIGLGGAGVVLIGGTAFIALRNRESTGRNPEEK